MIEYPRQPGSVTMTKQRYEEVADDLRNRIQTGEYPPGSRLPSRAELMREYQCSDTVIGKAMMLLRAENRIETQAGVAVFVKRGE